ncbi:MAG: V-type ATP synthase subunit E family protein [Candidatus Bathyarchaeia archaeon]
MSIQLISRIGEGILAEAKKEAAKKIEEAEKEARDILEKAREQALKEVANIKAKSDEEVKLVQSQSMSQARREIALNVLKEKDSLLRQAFQKASQRLGNMTNSEVYIRSLVKLISMSAPAIGEKNLKIKLNRRDLVYQNEIVKRLNMPDFKFKFDEQPINSIGGCIILSQDEKVKIDETYEARLATAEKTMRKAVAEILFPR